MDSSEGWAYKQANVILLKLVKNKEVLARNGGGKERKMDLFVVFWFFLKIQLTTLEHDTFIHLGWEILCLIVNQTSLKVFSRFLGISYGSIVTKPSAVSLCVQENSSNKPFICKISIIHYWPSLSQSLPIYFQNLIYDFMLWACLRRITFYRLQFII